MSETKKCSRCKREKPLSDFKSWNSGGVRKYRSECKQCNKDYERKYNAEYYQMVTIKKRRHKK